MLLLASALPGRAMAAPSVHLLIQKGTPIELRLAHSVSSANAHPGQTVDFVVIHDLQVRGFTVLRRGSTAIGWVVRVKHDHLLGIPGGVTLQLGSVELADGRPIQLSAQQKFRGRSHLLRMSVKMVLTAAVYWPLAPLFLLSHGRQSTVLAGTKITAYTVHPVSVPTWNLCPSTEGGLTLPQVLPMLPSRTTNYYGRPGDALNLVFWGTRADLEQAFARAGWIVPDKPTPRIIWPLIRHRWPYKKLPMFNLYVFGRPEDLAYVLPNPRLIVEQRHHVRIWKTDYELNGIPLWVGSATHDVSIKIVLHRLSIFHRINPNVDKERSFIGRDLAKH
ncbi:MAG: LssY C-terminal domain-containing protein [Acidobacteriaceae bacterium]